MMSFIVEPPKICFLSVWTRIRPRLLWEKFMKASVVLINRLLKWSGCLGEPVSIGLPWFQIVLSIIRDVKNVNGLEICNWYLLHHCIMAVSRLGLNFIGQINPPSSKGRHFVLVATDYLTKWTETVPLKNMTHREVFIDSVFLKLWLWIKVLYSYQSRYVHSSNFTRSSCSIHLHIMLRPMDRPSQVIRFWSSLSRRK